MDIKNLLVASLGCWPALGYWSAPSLAEGYSPYVDRTGMEPVTEVTQVKGDGEAHPWLSPDDEFADFGNSDKGDISGHERKTNDMLAFEYARSAMV